MRKLLILALFSGLTLSAAGAFGQQPAKPGAPAVPGFSQSKAFTLKALAARKAVLETETSCVERSANAIQLKQCMAVAKSGRDAMGERLRAEAAEARKVAGLSTTLGAPVQK